MDTIRFENIKEQSYTMKESLRALKTNIQFCGDDVKAILVTSSVPDEGKSTVATELARSFTESGKTVLLIDTDMRKSVLVGRLRAKTVSGKEVCGLSHYLSGQKKIAEVLYNTEVNGLFMIFAGPSVPNPTEILEKRYFSELIAFAKDNFDYVIASHYDSDHISGLVGILNVFDVSCVLDPDYQTDSKIYRSFKNKVQNEIHPSLYDTYDLSNDYIYIGTDELDLNDISVVNGISEIKDNKFLIKYNDDVLG